MVRVAAPLPADEERGLALPPRRGLARRALRATLEATWIPFELRSGLEFRLDRRHWPDGRPVTFNQHVRHKRYTDRDALLSTFADKVAVRQYVIDVLGPGALTELHAVVPDPAEIDLDALPRDFVVKATHGCGGIWVVTDDAPAAVWNERASVWARYCVTRDELDVAELHRTCREWLGRNYGRERREWAYLAVPPRLLVERYLRGPDGTGPAEFKFWVVGGRVQLVAAIVDRFTDLQLLYRTRHWEPAGLEGMHARPDQAPMPAPALLPEMIRMAEALAAPVDFLRVDLYSLGDRAVVGELTNYPSAGRQVFEPASFDLELGRTWPVR